MSFMMNPIPGATITKQMQLSMRTYTRLCGLSYSIGGCPTSTQLRSSSAAVVESLVRET